LLRSRYGLRLRLVGAADSCGAAYDPILGLDLAQVIALKRAGDTVGSYPAIGRRGWPALALVDSAQADLLFDASPVNIHQGAEPGLSCIRTALSRRMHVVTPNKGPLVLAYQELHDLAAGHDVQLRFDGTVAGGLPALCLGVRDLRGAEIHRIEAVPNLVTGYVLDLLAAGVVWEDALARAQQEGILEGDGSWDLEGWDAAAKLVILANAVLGVPASLEDVDVTGIIGLGADRLRAACDQGLRYRVLASAQRSAAGGYALTVCPTPLARDHPLGHLNGKQMGVLYETDIYGTLTACIEEVTPVPSAATMLRDVLDIYTR